MSDRISTSNIDIYKKVNYCVVGINPKIFPLDIIYSAAYVFLDKAYVLIDGNPSEEIIVELRPKTKMSLERLGREFNNELVNYAQYKIRSEKNAPLRQIILQRALFTNDPELTETNESEDADYLKDPEGIAIPWEKKYGKKKKRNENKKR